jgi:hypothetical protein
MDINEDLLDAAAIGFELGLPLILIYFCSAFPGKRPLWVPMLGAITPIIMFFGFTTFGYFFLNKDEFSFSFFAQWQMGYFVYCLLLLLGLIMGIALQTQFNLYWRYGLAFVFAPLIAWGFLTIENIVA